MSENCRIQKTGETYSINYNNSTASIYCPGGDVATSVPSAPFNVIASPNNSSVTLTWTAPNNNGSPITDYKIEYYSTNGSFWTEFSDSVSSSTSRTITGLTNGTLYIFKVYAINSIGDSNPSEFSNVVRPFTTPGAPSITSLVRLAGSGEAISITWSAPLSDGGSPIQQYSVEYSSDNGASWSTKTVSGNILSTIVDNLVNHESYIFRVVAINAAGRGTVSASSNPILPATTPLAPTIQSTTIGNSQLSIVWTAPGSDGGSNITDYSIKFIDAIQYSTDFSNWITFNDGQSTNTTTIITGLTNGVAYFWRVAAINTVGTGPYSSLSSLAYGIPGTVPNSPTNLVATASDSSASLEWTAPISDGGYTINEYRIQYSIDGGPSAFIQDVDGSITSIDINGLQNGASYTFSVAAKNALGYSSYSSNSNTVIPNSTTGNITTDYSIILVDEAHPLYVKGSGNVGVLWGADLSYHRNLLPNHYDTTIVFDIDTPFVAKGIYKENPISSDPFYVYPTGVNTSDLVYCYLPIPEENVVQIARPSGGIEYTGSSPCIGSISASTFATGIVNTIENLWGINFWSRMEDSYNSLYKRPCKLWIAMPHKPSLGSGVLTSGVDIFKNYTTQIANWNANQTPIYVNECGERYLNWISDCILYQGDPRSCDNAVQTKDITQDNECGNNDGNRLTTFYLNNICSGIDQKLNSSYGIGSSQILSPLFACTGVYYSNLVQEFNDNNQIIATWDYTQGDEENFGGCYSIHQSGIIRLLFENGVPKLDIISYCEDNCWGYGEGGGLFYPTTETKWTTFVPLDNYGIPSGVIEYESPEYSTFYFRFYGTDSKLYPDDDPLLYENYITYLNNESYQNDFDTSECVFPNIKFESSSSCSTVQIPGYFCLSDDTLLVAINAANNIDSRILPE